MTEDRLRELLLPFLATGGRTVAPVPEDLYGKLAAYLELLLRWNARTNLTAVRLPEEIVTRHFGESLFTAMQLAPHLPPEASLLDVGSGAGFPGIPIQLALPGVAVTLAESQGKKASFLREAVRVLGLHAEVWPGRVQAMAADRRFSVVTLRAVDRMAEALAAGASRLGPGGVLAELVGDGAAEPGNLVRLVADAAIPTSEQRVLRLWWLPLG